MKNRLIFIKTPSNQGFFIGIRVGAFGIDVSSLLHRLHDRSLLLKWPFLEESVCEVHLSFGQLSLLFDAFGMCFTAAGTVNNAGKIHALKKLPRKSLFQTSHLDFFLTKKSSFPGDKKNCFSLAMALAADNHCVVFVLQSGSITKSEENEF